MTIDCPVLFLGPTLTADRALAILTAELRPPAARGDVYRAALEQPRAILLVDGAFEDVPAVLHKEILWALKEGIHVFGAASIGALRAAELHSFGMVGIGEVFEAYREGRLQRDDAVAVLHGPAELGWPQLTRSLVDIQATLAAAERDGILAAKDRIALEEAAEIVFWRDRTYPAVVERALAHAWSGERADAFLTWVVYNEVYRKERDCVELLEHVASHWRPWKSPLRRISRSSTQCRGRFSRRRSSSARSAPGTRLSKLRWSGRAPTKLSRRRHFFLSSQTKSCATRTGPPTRWYSPRRLPSSEGGTGSRGPRM